MKNDEVSRFLHLLHRPGNVVEVRVLDVPRAGTVAGYFDDFEKLAAAAARWDGKANVYITMNPVVPALLARAANRLVARPKATTSDADVAARRWFLVDVDPVRPAGICATDEEKAAALERAEFIREWLAGRGWPEPVVADTGNGAYLLYRVDLVNDDAARDLIRDCLLALSLRFDDRNAAIDTTVFNAARIIRLVGTMNVKGDDVPDRPHRRSKLLRVPETLEPVPVEKLRELAALAPRPQFEPRAPGEGGFDVEAWLASHGLPVVQKKPWAGGGTVWILNPCPMNESHTNKSAFVVRFANGAIAAGCHHNSCRYWGWQDLREKYEPRSGARQVRSQAEKEDRRTQADVLIEIAQNAELFHDEEREPFAAVQIAGHREVWPVRSRYFKRWLAGQFFEREGKAANSDAMNQALGVIEALAVFRGECHPLHLRVAEHDRAFWYDLADAAWRAVRISPAGWQVVDRPPVLFRRHQNTGPQALPERGGDLRQLLLLTNVKERDDQELLLVYVVTMLVPGIPKPILDVFGEKGSGKTTLMRMLRALIDPAVEPLLVLRGDERELAIQLAHNYAPFFDNLSGLSSWQSDMLCRAATGAGFTTRMLYTDDEEKIFRFKRAVGVNGIHLLTGGTDLQDRFLTIELERIDRGDRAEERQILEEFEQMRPRLFGAILDALSKAMRIKPRLELSELPRMADFAAWGAAVAEALKIGAKRFLAAYWRNIGQVNERILQSHPVAAAVVALLNETPEWQGTPAQLLEALEQVAEREKINTRGKTWPKSANALTRRLKEIASNLADAGIDVEHLRLHGGVRAVRVAKVSSPPSPGGPESREPAPRLAFPGDDSGDDTGDDIEAQGKISSPLSSPAGPSNDAGWDDGDDNDDNFILPSGEEVSLEDDDDLPF